MCGRFALKNPDAVRAAFELRETLQMPPRHNIAPTQDVAIVRADPSGRHIALARWGLIPYWAPDAKIAHSTINARAETVDVKPAFREAFHHQRCLIPADGFYEWQREGGVKIPHLLARKDGAPFAFAGLWDVWPGPAGVVLSCSVIVTDANALVRPLHDRMPVILSPVDYARWLDPAYHDTERLKSLLVPAPDYLLVEHPVSPSINNPKNEWPQFSSDGPQP